MPVAVLYLLVCFRVGNSMGAGDGQQARRATIAGLIIAPIIASVATFIFNEPHTKEVCYSLNIVALNPGLLLSVT